MLTINKYTSEDDREEDYFLNHCALLAIKVFFF